MARHVEETRNQPGTKTIKIHTTIVPPTRKKEDGHLS